jgi:hypothetical protein
MNMVQLSENARHLSRCIIGCGMRFHGNNKEIVTIIGGAQCDSLGHTSSVEPPCGLSPGSVS